MARNGIVQSVERVVRDDVPQVEVRVDLGGGEPLTLEHVDSSGEDSPPMPGDSAAISESTGAGAARSAGYLIPLAGKAANGEKRLFSRELEDGKTVSAELWMKGNGDVEITSITTGGAIILNGVRIDQQGNITTPGDVTVKKDTTPIVLSTHKHGSGTGPTTPPLFPTP